jgi:prolyl-tRNA synthetase
MADLKFPTRSEDFSECYNQLVLRAEFADYAPVRGCMIVRPYRWALWENITAQLERRYKAFLYGPKKLILLASVNSNKTRALFRF